MALHYCSLHQRLFSRRCQRWVCFSPATIHAMRGYDALLCSTNTDAAFLHVIELSRDHCAASLRTIAQRTPRMGLAKHEVHWRPQKRTHHGHGSEMLA